MPTTFKIEFPRKGMSSLHLNSIMKQNLMCRTYLSIAQSPTILSHLNCEENLILTAELVCLLEFATTPKPSVSGIQMNEELKYVFIDESYSIEPFEPTVDIGNRQSFMDILLLLESHSHEDVHTFKENCNSPNEE